MVVVAGELAEVPIPEWVVDLDSYRRWAHSDEFPKEGRICWLKGQVWIDMSKEQVYTHIQVKTDIASVWNQLRRASLGGLVLGDGLLLSNFVSDTACIPDGAYISRETLVSDRIRILESARGGFTEIQGSPDALLEVVSRSSIRKDTVVLKQAYWEAGVREYWLIDARREPLKFDIFRHTPRGYAPTRKVKGWLKSEVFGKSFRLTQTTNPLGHPEFLLEVK